MPFMPYEQSVAILSWTSSVASLGHPYFGNGLYGPVPNVPLVCVDRIWSPGGHAVRIRCGLFDRSRRAGDVAVDSHVLVQRPSDDRCLGRSDRFAGVAWVCATV